MLSSNKMASAGSYGCQERENTVSIHHMNIYGTSVGGCQFPIEVLSQIPARRLNCDALPDAETGRREVVEFPDNPMPSGSHGPSRKVPSTVEVAGTRGRGGVASPDNPMPSGKREARRQVSRRAAVPATGGQGPAHLPYARRHRRRAQGPAQRQLAPRPAHPRQGGRGQALRRLHPPPEQRGAERGGVGARGAAAVRPDPLCGRARPPPADRRGGAAAAARRARRRRAAPGPTA
jgi:hypothetical protein